jgi:hypothetical protein
METFFKEVGDERQNHEVWRRFVYGSFAEHDNCIGSISRNLLGHNLGQTGAFFRSG